MEIQWIAIAFVFGFIAKRFGQPPLVGYLVAGLFLEAIGFRMASPLHDLSDVGIKLLLFSIGLKLDLKSIARPEVWGVASIHILVTTALFGSAALALGALGVPLLSDLTLGSATLVGFALSFSSTVFVVKVLEERDDVLDLYGRVAVGVLIVQDLVAVIFLSASEGKVPSPFALLLVVLLFARPLMHRFLRWCGHGELLVLAGFALALGGSSLFQAVSIKGELGALFFGVLAGHHAKSDELAKAIASFKDIFLVGFFISVGLTGLPTLPIIAVALGLLLFALFKSALFHVLFVRFRLRARTSFFASLSLGNFSEFGLIVGALAVTKGWLSADWVIVFSMAVVFSLVLSSPLNSRSYQLYGRFRIWLYRWERPDRLPDEQPLVIPDARVYIFGLGRIGTAAYDELKDTYGDTIVGFDIDDERIAAHNTAGRRVFKASATDADAFGQLNLGSGAIELVLLSMSAQLENRNAVRLLRRSSYKGIIAVTARYEDDEYLLRKAGADLVVHVMNEAGIGFARDALRKVAASRPA